MKIAFDSLIFTTQRFGGVSRYITSLAGALNNLDVEARIFGKYHINHYLEASRGIADAGMAAIAKFPPKSRRAVHYLNDLIGRRSLTRWGADIVHESFHHSSAIAGSSLPRVCTVHDMIYEVFSDQLPGHEKSSLLKKESVERSDRVICISQKTKEDLMAQFGTSESKISVVHHGSEWLGEAESALVLSEAIANVAGHALKNAKPYLLFVGTRRNYKNF
ncbi:glycosyltransferase, partial [Akkermansiaceae bacterium]|nr:glycosyltransferase [Akkermansiaceae bacterium]